VTRVSYCPPLPLQGAPAVPLGWSVAGPDRRTARAWDRYHRAMYQLWLFLHILGAIAAFGFGFYAPIFGRASAAEPQHGNWYLRAAKRVSNGVLVPVAISMFITGTLLVVETGGMERFQELWLAVAFVLYVIALLVVFLVQRPALNKVIELTSEPPGPDGPPPELPALVQRMQLAGIALLVLPIAIVALMVWKPQL
jgi:uncharacterized membrane protein